MNALIPLIAAAGAHDGSGWHHGACWVVLPILGLLLAAVVVALVRRRGRGTGGTRTG